jgi:hypothetical protein
MTQALTRMGSLLHPILFASFPLLSLFVQNQTDVELSVLWPPLVVCVAGVTALYGLFLLVTRRATKAGALTSVVVVGFFYFGILFENLSGLGLSEGWFVLPWIAVIAAGALLVARTHGPLANLTLIAVVGAAVLALPSAAKVASYQSDHPAISPTDPRLWPTTLAAPPAAQGTKPPDIYVIMPDDYPRPDVLRQFFHYDDSSFLRGLQRRGFVISPQVRSPYSDSESNMSSALNMDYLGGLPKILGAKSQDVRPVKRLLQDNRASRLLKSAGYRYVHIDTDEVTFGGSNPQISPLAPPDSFANLWMRKTILHVLGGPLGFSDSATNTRFRSAVRSQFSKLAALPPQPGPKFVVFHTLLPHDPYVYSAGGQGVTFPGHSDAALASTLGKSYFLRQLEFLNAKLLGVVDAIQRSSKAPAVIVIESDEGFQADPDAVGEATMRDVRVKGLSALYLPGLKKGRVPQPPNTVNTLRFVFNRYLGTHYPMLRSASYPEGDLPYDFQAMRVR